jgi:hypothetical protein
MEKCKTISGSSTYSPSNHTTFSQTQTDATIPLRPIPPKQTKNCLIKSGATVPFIHQPSKAMIRDVDSSK